MTYCENCQKVTQKQENKCCWKIKGTKRLLDAGLPQTFNFKEMRYLKHKTGKCNKMRYVYICIMGIPEEEKEKGQNTYLKQYWLGICHTWEKSVDIQITEAQQIANR